MFRPNTFAMWTKREKNYNQFGEPVWARPVRTPCAVVEMRPSMVATPIRTDASASHSSADEINTKAILLIEPKYAVQIGDRFEIDGYKLRVTSVEVRRAVSGGRIDHLELHLEAWWV